MLILFHSLSTQTSHPHPARQTSAYSPALFCQGQLVCIENNGVASVVNKRLIAGMAPTHKDWD